MGEDQTPIDDRGDDTDGAPVNPSFDALDDEVAWRCPIARDMRHELGFD